MLLAPRDVIDPYVFVCVCVLVRVPLMFSPWSSQRAPASFTKDFATFVMFVCLCLRLVCVDIHVFLWICTALCCSHAVQAVCAFVFGIVYRLSPRESCARVVMISQCCCWPFSQQILCLLCGWVVILFALITYWAGGLSVLPETSKHHVRQSQTSFFFFLQVCGLML